MMRKKLLSMIGLFLLVSSIALGAQLTFPQIRSENNEMRKSVIWLMEGLQELSMSKDKSLNLRSEQKRKILPVFNALVSKKIIPLKSESNQYNNSNRGQYGNMDPGDPKVQERMKGLQEQTAFGNKQVDLIDGILTRKQAGFIDNLNFKAEKYGFYNYQNNGQSGGQGQGQFQRSDPQQMAKLRQQMQAGRANQVKLCQSIEKILKAK